MAARAVLVVRPACFGFNPDTHASNPGQRRLAVADEEVGRRARAELDGVVERLEAAGVRVILEEDTPDPPKPDAVFPNNWLATFPDGRVVVFPMHAPSRRAEVRGDIVQRLRAGHRVTEVVDLRGEPWRALEGTGSLVFDHVGRRAWASVSARTDPDLASTLCARLGYRLTLFHADVDGLPPYHTNVLLSVGDGYAVWVPESVVHGDRDRVAASLVETGRALIPLDLGEMRAYAPNQLALAGRGATILLSSGALRALRPSSRRALEGHGELLPVDIPTIEAVGGGSARCLVAEVHLEPLPA